MKVASGTSCVAEVDDVISYFFETQNRFVIELIIRDAAMFL